MSFVPPVPDIAKLREAWDTWERGEETPGRVLANLKTSGMRELLALLSESGWTPSK